MVWRVVGSILHGRPIELYLALHHSDDHPLPGRHRTLKGNASTLVRNEVFYLMTHSTHFIYGYMASDIWLRTILIVRKETRCRHIGYSFRLTARVLLYAPSHRQDSTYHSLCYTSRVHWLKWKIAQWRIDPTTHRTMSKHSYHRATSRSGRKCFI